MQRNTVAIKALLGSMLLCTAVLVSGCKDKTETPAKQNLPEYALDSAFEKEQNRHSDKYKGTLQQTTIVSPENVAPSTINKKYTMVDIVNDPKKQGSSPNLRGNTKRSKVAEIEFTGEDNTNYFTAVNGDVAYDGVTYFGLDEAVSNLPLPVSKESLINFIVKTYTPNITTKSAVCYYYDYSLPRAEDDFTIDISDDLENNWSGYSALLTKYGSQPTWTIQLYESEKYTRPVMLIGSKDYVLYSGSDDSLIVDLNAYAEIVPNTLGENDADRQIKTPDDGAGVEPAGTESSENVPEVSTENPEQQATDETKPAVGGLDDLLG